MKILKLNTALSPNHKEIIFNLWNSEYPSQLAFKNASDLDIYLNNLLNPKHYFVEIDNEIKAWAFAFERDSEIWFAIIVNSNFQNRKVGSTLLNELKLNFEVLNGWVIDHQNYLHQDGRTYHSPLNFYTKNGFEIIKETRIEIPTLSAIKIKWQKYLFKSKRLGFRNWFDNDLQAMAKISADKEVMAYFPSTQSVDFVADFIQRMQREFSERRHCYFAVEILETSELIGFIGLHQQTFEADFTPCIDIGWRLKKEVWNNGYATEGAIRCLKYGFDELKIKRIYAITPKINLKSERIMQKIGMKKIKYFIFEPLKDDERLKECVLYSIDRVNN